MKLLNTTTADEPNANVHIRSGFKIGWWLNWLLIVRLLAHGYMFSQTNEEMKDRIEITIESQRLTVRYDSEYLGQIAPHIRNMIDQNRNLILTRPEIDAFFSRYRAILNETCARNPLYLNQKQIYLKNIECSAPRLLSDSLLAPFNIQMTFSLSKVNLAPGGHEFEIDPKLFFLNGNVFIEMAKKEVEFTPEQEKALARFLDVRVFAGASVQFMSTFPGYIKKDKKSVFIYGVFYDESILQIQNLQYPKIKIKFQVGTIK
ncbi:hypothetical protein L0128_15900 [candidate division KSB1 bacterium]|nr:hypothetical protein [candidate division KSB1 bacterium]